MSKVSLWTFSFLIIPQPFSIYFKSSRPTYHLPAAVPLWILHEDKCVEKKGAEEGWQACVTGERFTWGHKSWGERRGGISHIKGSVCGDREVNWPSQVKDRTAHVHHLHTPIHALPSGLWLFGFGQNTPTHLSSLSHSLSCLLFPLEEYLGLHVILSSSPAHKSPRMVPPLPVQLSLCLEATSRLSSPLTPSIPMWARVDGSQGTMLPEETKETL